MTDCIETNCKRPAFARGVCRKHYDEQRKAEAEPCCVEGCERRAYRRGMCDAHYRAELAKKNPPCSVPGCDAPPHAHGYCVRHYYRYRTHGSTENPKGNDWGSREEHPQYSRYMRHRKGTPKTMVKEWADDFWAFVDAIGEQPEGHQLRRKDVKKPIGPGNWYWKESYGSEDKAAYMREWRKKNKEKEKSYYLKRNFGITMDGYKAIWDAQDGKCAICGKHPKGDRYANLCVDHCHDNGHVRGLLCDHCNRGIGLLEEDVGILQRAIAYLEG